MCSPSWTGTVAMVDPSAPPERLPRASAPKGWRHARRRRRRTFDEDFPTLGMNRAGPWSRAPDLPATLDHVADADDTGELAVAQNRYVAHAVARHQVHHMSGQFRPERR